MRMLFLFLAISLVGCGIVDVKPAPKIAPPTASAVPSSKKGLTDAEYKRLTKDCQVVQIPENGLPKPVDDLAVDVALARKVALEECTERMRKLRKARNDH